MVSSSESVPGVAKTQGPADAAGQVRQVGDRRVARGRRGTDQAGDQAFTAALNEATASEKFSPEFQAQLRKAERAAAEQILARAEKRPTRTPPEIAADESERLYTASKTATAQGDANADPKPLSSNEFITAASRYADRFFSVTKAYAKPGDSLEVKA